MNDKADTQHDADRLAEAVRSACLQAAVEAFDRGGMAGLCNEGRQELVLDAIQTVELAAIVSAVRGKAE